jgi:hypothetical protein
MLSPRRGPLALAALTIILANTAPSLLARQTQVASERSVGLTVDFIALDASGVPVADLHAAEVEIRIADRVRVVRALRRVTAAPEDSAPPVPPPYGTNDGVAAGRRFVLVIDQESFVAGRELLFRNAIEGLLAQLTPTDRTMIAALPFGGVVTNFTSDIARIRLAAGRVTGQGSRTESGSDLACRTRRFLESLEGWLLQQPVGTSPMTLVLFTAGLAAPRRDAPMGLVPGMCELEVEKFRNLAAAASGARANFYVMQPAEVGGSSTRQTFGGVGDIGSDNPLEGIEHLAGVTGGTRLALDATGTASLLRVARESTAYYVAELEPAADEAFGRNRPLSVRVARKGVAVRTRPEIRFERFVATSKGRLVVTELLASTEAFPELRLRIDGFTAREADGRLRLGILIEPVDRSVRLESAGAIVIAPDGRVVGNWSARSASDRPLLGAVSAAAGAYRLRVAAIDAAGRAGAAEQDVDVALVSVGPLFLGSLMLGVSREGSTAPLLEFGSEPTGIAYFDIYGGAQGLPLAVRLEVARSVDGPAVIAQPMVLTRADEARVVASGTVPVGALPAGDYIVRGIVRLESGETGRVLRTLRKVAK